jgi:ATP phosphoribosyltransferase
MTRLRIAIPKGRLQAAALEVFAAAGLSIPSSENLASRRLVFETADAEWILVKDGDVPVYVEFGAADLGVAGFDQILEQQPDVYQSVEFAFGRCRMMLIAGEHAPPLAQCRTVATKYPKTAGRWFRERGLHPDIVPLQGSVELAAVLNLAPYIVDLVESGETVRIHRLNLVEEIAAISPRLLVNKSSYRCNREPIAGIVAQLSAALEEVTP